MTQIDSNANPKQRNVAFGKNLSSTRTSSNNINSSINNRLILYQLNNYHKQRGFSVPNLGFSFFFFDFRKEMSFYNLTYCLLIFFFSNLILCCI